MTQPGKSLTARETEILSLRERGQSLKAIAGELRISLNTVKAHLARVFLKTGTHSSAEAIFKLRQIT